VRFEGYCGPVRRGATWRRRHRWVPPNAQANGGRFSRQCGEAAATREITDVMLREVATRPASLEACTAHRLNGNGPSYAPILDSTATDILAHSGPMPKGHVPTILAVRSRRASLKCKPPYTGRKSEEEEVASTGVYSVL
jgi:hypothetical protein